MGSRRFRDAAAAAARVIASARPPLPWIALLALGFILAAALGALPPLYTGRIIDALQHLDAAGALRELAVYAALTIGCGLVQAASSYASTGLRETIVRNLRLALMRKIYRARFDDVRGVTLGEIANRVMGDTESLCNQLEYAVLPTVAGLATIAATLTVMLLQNVTLSLISIALLAATALPLRIVTPRLAAMQKRISATRDDVCGIVNETATLSALAILRNVQASQRQAERLGVLTASIRSMRLSQSLLAGFAGFGTTLLNVAGPALILAVGTWLLVHHRISSVGIIVAFLLFHGRLSNPVSALSALPMQIASVGVIAQRLLDVFDLRDETSGGTAFAAGDLCYRNVSVAREERRILDGVTATIPRGAHAAIVGPSGSGKSTLSTLALRLNDPESGSIDIASHALPEIALPSLRESVAIVSQDPLVFDTTLLENLTYCNPRAETDAIKEAIAICRLQELLVRLPHGLDECLGQRGFRLSGGERQRICLARALVQKPDVLILDEALTGVDVEMEREIIAGVRAVHAGKTLIVITHRLPSIDAFDPIIVLENGRLVACGTHDEVQRQSAWYRLQSAVPELEHAVAR